MIEPTSKLSLDLSAVESDYPEVFAYIDELRAALKPFAKYGSLFISEIPDAARVAYAPHRFKETHEPTVGDCRRAAEALGEK